ncbi:LytR/AlgR family response regulator transcription factor [Clostridium hydrogeniformans]|uniref:LytR/AlgR family response regulator transcription factor n=1 Tax=Clostridium hydrogeniformans TaxID=349933 RepID=UPI0004810A91|nr:LytTR family DNA-binding domain-containing protein [Clostridium hydrogeniformans]
MSLKVLIVDDEEAMRKILKKAVEKSKGFDIVGEVSTGDAAIEIFKREKPNLVFLDVEMDGMNGVECAKILVDIDSSVKIIFATGYSDYMTEAFELYAFDYIVKPFKLDRIYKTLDRIRDLTEIEVPKLPVLKEELGFTRLIIKNKDGINFLDMKDIILVQREQGSTVIYLEDGSSYTTSEGLLDIEEKLDKRVFFRSHKSYIINLTKINKIYPYGRWTYVVKLKNIGEDALLTHEKYEDIKRLFS